MSAERLVQVLNGLVIVGLLLLVLMAFALWSVWPLLIAGGFCIALVSYGHEEDQRP